MNEENKLVSEEEIKEMQLDEEEISMLEDFRSGKSRVLTNLSVSDEHGAILINAAKNFRTTEIRNLMIEGCREVLEAYYEDNTIIPWLEAKRAELKRLEEGLID